jgi:hypothetical protein
MDFSLPTTPHLVLDAQFFASNMAAIQFLQVSGLQTAFLVIEEPFPPPLLSLLLW